MSFIFIPPPPPLIPKLHYWAPDINDYPNVDNHDVENFYKKEIHMHSKKIFMLKLWCFADPRIPKTITTTQLVQFFYATNLSILKAFELLLKHFAIINYLPEIFTDRIPRNRDLIRAWNVIKLASFPVMTSKGSRIIYTSIYPIKDEEYNMIIHVKLFTMGLEALLLLEGIPKGGYSIIIDTREFPIVNCFTDYKSYVIKYLHYFQEGSQFIVNDVHVLCYPGYNDRFKWMRNYLSKEMNDKLYFHVCGSSEMWKFYEFFPKNCLPKELTGFLSEEIATLTKKMKIMIESLKLYFKTEETQRKSIPDLDIDEMKKNAEKAIENAETRIQFRNEQIELLRTKRERKRADYNNLVYRKSNTNVLQIKQTRNLQKFIAYDPYEITFEDNLETHYNI